MNVFLHLIQRFDSFSFVQHKNIYVWRKEFHLSLQTFTTAGLVNNEVILKGNIINLFQFLLEFDAWIDNNSFFWFLNFCTTIKVKCQRRCLFRNMSERNEIKENCDTIKKKHLRRWRWWKRRKMIWRWEKYSLILLVIMFHIFPCHHFFLPFISNRMTLIKRDNMVFSLHFLPFYRWVDW